MYCQNCGKEIVDNARFCQYCGQEIGQISKKEEVDNKKDCDNENTEYIIYSAKKHWITLVPCFVWGFFLIFSLIAATNTQKGEDWLWFLAFLILTIHPYLRYKFDKIEISNKSFNLQQGIFNIERINMPLNKINTYYINQGLLGRILNYGAFVFQSGAKVGNSSYNFIKEPNKLIEIINNIESYKK